MTNETNNTQPTETIKAILIGRHAGEIPGVEVVEQLNIEWSLDPQECDKQFDEAYQKAVALRGALVLQNMPGVLAGAMTRAFRGCDNGVPMIGVVVGKPGPRTAGVRKQFHIGSECPGDVIAAVEFANPRAKLGDPSEPINMLTIEVDPIAPFEFVRIEWLY